MINRKYAEHYDLHPLNTLYPNNSKEDGISTDLSDEHPMKALFSIDLTEGGIFIFISEVHPLNEYWPIFIIFEDKTILVNVVQLLNK